MKIWHKAVIAVSVVLVIGGIAWFSIYKANQNVVTVQTARVARQDLISLVTASGEVRPKTYTNVLGEGIAKITDIVVKEGDHVKKGDVLLHLENIQPGADVQAQVASIDAAQSGMKAAAASFDSAVATAAQRPSDLTQPISPRRSSIGSAASCSSRNSSSPSRISIRPKRPSTALSQPRTLPRHRSIRRGRRAIRRARTSNRARPC